MKTKIIAILSIMVIIVSIFSMSVSAEINTTPDYPFPNCSSLIGKKDYVIYKAPSNANNYVLLVFNEDISTIYLKQNNGEWANFSSNNKRYKSDSTTLLVDGTTDSPFTLHGKMYIYKPAESETWQGLTNQSAYISKNTGVVCYSNNNINYLGNEVNTSLDQIFFQKAPLQKSILSGALREVHYLIPYLAVFLIGLVAFWKGYQFLSTQLHRV